MRTSRLIEFCVQPHTVDRGLNHTLEGTMAVREPKPPLVTLAIQFSSAVFGDNKNPS